MFAFLKRSTKKTITHEAVNFVGKCLADLEYVAFGNDEEYISYMQQYLKKLHKLILETENLKDRFSSRPVCYFFEYTKETDLSIIGRLGPGHDKSNRCYPFIFSRRVLNNDIQKYPLFIPSLYNDFFNLSDQLLNDSLKKLELSEFKELAFSMQTSSIYLELKQVLKTSMSNLINCPIDNYIENLNNCSAPNNYNNLLSSWHSWRQEIINENDLNNLLPLMLELPNNTNLHHYIAFVCQLIEPLFSKLEGYRILWWRDPISSKAWCFITNQGLDANKDLQLFEASLTEKITCFSYSENINDPQPQVNNLFEALQILTET